MQVRFPSDRASDLRGTARVLERGSAGGWAVTALHRTGTFSLKADPDGELSRSPRAADLPDTDD
jgi:hypothetical protein